jgi:hypothetical protein
MKRSDVKFIRKKQERKAAALIALALHKEGEKGDCLTDEEMASLVEESCSAAEKESCWIHLSGCRQCYEQWYFLKSGGQHYKKEGLLVYLMRGKNLALAGSALAVAASVAVVLNIFHDPLTGGLVEKPVASLQMAEEADVSFLPEVDGGVAADENVLQRETVPAPVAAAGREKNDQLESKIQPEKSITVSGAEKEILRDIQASGGRLCGFQEPEAKITVKSRRAPVAAASGDDPFAQWLESVRQGCLQKRTEEDFWADITRSGERLLPETADNADLGREERKVMVILQMVPRRYDPDSVVKQCDLIVVKLAEEGNNR